MKQKYCHIFIMLAVFSYTIMTHLTKLPSSLNDHYSNYSKTP
jgi:hypothetical protein